MCQPASFVLTKNRVYWSLSTDSHTEIIEEHGIHEDGVRGVNVVKIEITPPNGDMRIPLDQWRYKVDQDMTPDWYDADDAERRCRKSLSDWADARLFIDAENVVLTGKTHVFCYGESRVEAWGSSRVVARGSSRVEAWESSSVEAWESSSVVARESSRVEKCDDRSVIRFYSSSQLPAPNGPHAVVIDSRGDKSVCITG